MKIQQKFADTEEKLTLTNAGLPLGNNSTQLSTAILLLCGTRGNGTVGLRNPRNGTVDLRNPRNGTVGLWNPRNGIVGLQTRENRTRGNISDKVYAKVKR